MTDMALALGQATHKSCAVWLAGNCKAASVSLCLKCLRQRVSKHGSQQKKGRRHAANSKSK